MPIAETLILTTIMEAVRLPDCVLGFGCSPSTGLLLDSDDVIEIHSESVLTYVEDTWYEKEKKFEVDRNSVSLRLKRKKKDDNNNNGITASKRQKLVVVSSFGESPPKEDSYEPPEYYYSVLPDCYNAEDENKKLKIAATGSRLNWNAYQTSSVFTRLVNKRIENRMDSRKVIKNKKMSKELKRLQRDMISEITPEKI